LYSQRVQPSPEFFGAATEDLIKSFNIPLTIHHYNAIINGFRKRADCILRRSNGDNGFSKIYLEVFRKNEGKK
jgi:hypothetical protein